MLLFLLNRIVLYVVIALPTIAFAVAVGVVVVVVVIDDRCGCNLFSVYWWKVRASLRFVVLIRFPFRFRCFLLLLSLFSFMHSPPTLQEANAAAAIAVTAVAANIDCYVHFTVMLTPPPPLDMRKRSSVAAVDIAAAAIVKYTVLLLLPSLPLLPLLL